MSANLFEKIDLDWLQEQAREVLYSNEVAEERDWNGTSQTCVFHAPLLDPQPDRPSWLHPWLMWMWRLWWNIKLPGQAFYPHQWFWDSCAHAIVLSHIDVKLAEKEIESLLYAQRPDGFIPHMIWNKARMHWADRMMQWFYPSRHVSPYIQPPVLAEAVECLYKQGGNIEFVIRVLPRLKKYYLYLDIERSRSNDGLLEIIISYESGKDRSPEYDRVYGESSARPLWRGPMPKLMIRHRIRRWNLEKIFAANLFRVKDVHFNCIYARNLRALSRLCQAAGEEEEGQSFGEKSSQVEESILSKMYDQETGLFYSLDARHGRDEQIKVSTVSSLMPLILDSIEEAQAERLVREHLVNPAEFWTRYPLPAVPVSSAEEVKGHIIWRGLQTWIYPNWYIARGLRRQAQRFPQRTQDYNRIADELARRTYELVQKEGFCDFYHSQTGARGAGPKFGWSTLLLDMVYDLKADSGMV